MFYCFMRKLDDEIAKKNTTKNTVWMQYRKNRETFQWLNFQKTLVFSRSMKNWFLAIDVPCGMFQPNPN